MIFSAPAARNVSFEFSPVKSVSPCKPHSSKGRMDDERIRIVIYRTGLSPHSFNIGPSLVLRWQLIELGYRKDQPVFSALNPDFTLRIWPVL
jgi:hypothetical protein